MGKFFFHMLLGLAEFERNLIAERTSLALQHLKEQGIKLGRPTGITSESVAALERARELRAKGNSLRQIAGLLDEEGYSTARGKGWSAEAVRKLLTREAA